MAVSRSYLTTTSLASIDTCPRRFRPRLEYPVKCFTIINFKKRSVLVDCHIFLRAHFTLYVF